MRLHKNLKHSIAALSLVALGSAALPSTALADMTTRLLSGWDNANEIGANTATHGPLWTGANTLATQPNGQGTTPINGDGLPLPLSLNGRWYVKDSNGSAPALGTDVRLSHSTTPGTFYAGDPDFPGSTGSLKLTQGGSSRGGGDTHYNFAAAGMYLYEPFNATGNVLLDDPRGDELRYARDNPNNYKFEFDVIFDVENMIRRDPTTGTVLDWFADPNFSVGLYMSNGVNAGGNNWITNNVLDPNGDGGANILSGDQTFDLDDADPSDAVGSTPVAPIRRHVSVKFPNAAWPILMTNGTGSLFQTQNLTLAGTTADLSGIAVGFVINGNWSNGDVTTVAGSQSVYLDNLKLVFFDPIVDARNLIDFNNDNLANEADWTIFTANHLLPGSTYTPGANNPADLTCGSCWWDKGDVDHDGDNDFQDYLAFANNYNIVHPPAGNGASAFDRMVAGVPEPSCMMLTLIGVVGCGVLRRRRTACRVLPCLLLLFMAVTRPAQAQLLESFEAPNGITGWELVGGGANDAIALDAAHHSLGAQSMSIMHEESDGNADLTIRYWNTGDTAFDAFANAINLGPELFRLKMDVIYDAAQLPQVESVGVSLYLGTNQGSQRLGNADDTGLVPWTTGEGNVTKTIDVALSDLAPTGGHLGDVEADNNGQIQLQIGLNGVQTPTFPFKVFVDNIRLEQVDTPDFLTLAVNRTSGEVMIKNNDSEPINLSYYEIRSAAGGLRPANWNSLDDHEPGDPSGTGWDEAGGVSANVLAELRFPNQGDATLAPGAMTSLGTIYNPMMDTKDLVFQYRNLARPNKLIGTGPAIVSAPGDYNQDGTVNAADYTTWRNALGSANALPNDDTAGVGADDYTRWKTNFGNTAGVGVNPVDYLVTYTPAIGSGGGGLAGIGVPEPTSVVMGGMGLIVAFGLVRRRSCDC